jgi:hypothetical protein
MSFCLHTGVAHGLAVARRVSCPRNGIKPGDFIASRSTVNALNPRLLGECLPPVYQDANRAAVGGDRSDIVLAASAFGQITMRKSGSGIKKKPSLSRCA